MGGAGTTGNSPRYREAPVTPSVRRSAQGRPDQCSSARLADRFARGSCNCEAGQRFESRSGTPNVLEVPPQFGVQCFGYAKKVVHWIDALHEPTW